MCLVIIRYTAQSRNRDARWCGILRSCLTAQQGAAANNKPISTTNEEKKNIWTPNAVQPCPVHFHPFPSHLIPSMRSRPSFPNAKYTIKIPFHTSESPTHPFRRSTLTPKRTPITTTLMLILLLTSGDKILHEPPNHAHKPTGFSPRLLDTNDIDVIRAT